LPCGLTTSFYGLFGIVSWHFGWRGNTSSPTGRFLATIGIWLASSFADYMYFNPAWSALIFRIFGFPLSLVLDCTKLQADAAQWAALGCPRPDGNVLLSECYFVDLPRPRNDLPGSYGQRGPSKRRCDCKTGVVFNTVGAVFLLTLLPTFVTPPDYYGSPFEPDTLEFGLELDSPAFLRGSISPRIMAVE